MTKLILAAFATGTLHGGMFKAPTPTAVAPTAACVAAYMAGWAAGWADMTKYLAKFPATA